MTENGDSDYQFTDSYFGAPDYLNLSNGSMPVNSIDIDANAIANPNATVEPNQQLENAQITTPGVNTVETENTELDGKGGSNLEVGQLNADEVKAGKLEADNSGTKLSLDQAKLGDTEKRKQMNLRVTADAIDKVAGILTGKQNISVEPGQAPSINSNQGTGLGLRGAVDTAYGYNKNGNMYLSDDTYGVSINKDENVNEDVSLTTENSNPQTNEFSYKNDISNQINNVLEKKGKNIDEDKLIQQLSKTTGKSTDDIKKILAEKSSGRSSSAGRGTGPEMIHGETVVVPGPTTNHLNNGKVNSTITIENVPISRSGKSNNKAGLEEEKSRKEIESIESGSKGKKGSTPPVLLEDDNLQGE